VWIALYTLNLDLESSIPSTQRERCPAFTCLGPRCSALLPSASAHSCKCLAVYANFYALSDCMASRCGGISYTSACLASRNGEARPSENDYLVSDHPCVSSTNGTQAPLRNSNCLVYVRRLDMPANPLLLTVLLVGSCLLTAAQAPAPAPNASAETSPLTASSQPVCTSMLGGTNVSLIMVADPGDFTGTGDLYTGCTRHLWQDRCVSSLCVVTCTPFSSSGRFAELL